MAQGTLSGFIAGTVVSGLVVGAASVMTEVPGAGAPEATTLEVPAGSEFNQARDDTQADLPQSQETPDPSDVAKVAEPAPDDLSVIETDATQSAAQPETGDTEVALNAPEAGDVPAGISVETDSPVLSAPQAEAPQAPVAEEELSISTDPAQPVQPEISEEETVFTAPEPSEPAAEDTADSGSGAETAMVPEEVTATEAEPAEVTEAPQEDIADAAQADAEPAPDAGSDTVAVQDDVTAPSQPVIAEPEAEPDTAPVVQEEVAALEPPSEESSGTIDDIASNVTTDRLPSVAAPAPESEADIEEESTAPDAVVDPAATDSDLPPLERYAAEFENPDGKPLMSIVLIDDGSSPIGLDALKSFPYPLNFAVDAGWDGAGEAMQKYRDAGFEVLAMIDIPEGSGAADTEVSMQTYLNRIPEAVAVMEGDDTGLQSTRQAAEQMAQILRDTGHGAIMFSKGLNTAQKLIAREGVPSASVFRDFDAKGQNATVIRRFLDQAAFRAGQEEQGVVMVGRLRADTISALLLWGLQDRAGRVAVAPVSAVLTAQ